MFGAVFGRWWRVTLLASALGWPLLLVVTGAMSIEPALLGASALAVLNTGAGVLIHRGILHAGRTLWRAAGPSIGVRELPSRPTGQDMNGREGSSPATGSPGSAVNIPLPQAGVGGEAVGEGLLCPRPARLGPRRSAAQQA